MSQKKYNQEPPKLDIEKVQDLLKHIQVIPNPTPEKVRIRMKELRDLGLEDLPTYKGMRSSMRQYAEGSVADEERREKDPDKEPSCFVTTDEDLLRLADTLAQRYGLKVISLEAMGDLENKIRSGEIKTLNQQKDVDTYINLAK